MNPPCKLCGAPLLRWAWYEAKAEPVEYWYCLACDKVNREPCIQVLPRRNIVEMESQIDTAIKAELRGVGEFIAQMFFKNTAEIERLEKRIQVLEQKLSHLGFQIDC